MQLHKAALCGVRCREAPNNPAWLFACLSSCRRREADLVPSLCLGWFLTVKSEAGGYTSDQELRSAYTGLDLAQDTKYGLYKLA